MPTKLTTPPVENDTNSEPLLKIKAYEIDLDKLDEGYTTDTIMCHAECITKAKVKLLEQVKYDDWKLRASGDELTYLNIPVKRRKYSDKVIFEDKEVLRHEIESIINERERNAKLDEILSNPDITHCYIIKHGSYYRPHSSGYTSLRHEAGVYPKEKAVLEAKSVREISLLRCDAAEHNKMINENIAELRARLLEI